MEIVIAVAIVAALVEVVKKTNYLPKELMPFLAILLGVVITFVDTPAPLNEVVLTGIIIGLVSVGAYEGTKNGIDIIKR